MNVLISGKTSFKVEVPYKLIETGERGEKPILVYLHGRGQNLETFEKAMAPFLKFNAYHLYIQGPYADTQMTAHREKWGYMWYLYNGKQGSFIKSLEYTAEFIQEIIDHVRQFIKVNRLCIIGYSMGGYQAGYFGMTRWKHTNDMIVMGGRIKTEVLTQTRINSMKHQQILAIHGAKDDVVLPEPQNEAINFLKAKGINAELRLINEAHRLNSKYIRTATDWLLEKGYERIEG
jgi:predicted esterase